MKRILIIPILIIVLCIGISAKDNKNPYTDFSPEYTKVITGRADKIVKTLDISDTNQYNRVLTIIVDQYRSLSALHDFKDAQLNKAKSQEETLKEEKINIAKDSANAALYILHAHYIAKLSSELYYEQIEKVKDGMTYGRMGRDYNAMIEMIPSLTEEEKRFIFITLFEARELAMDQGSSKTKHHIFDKYRGRTNNYLSQRGYDLNQERIDWKERLEKESNKK